jgi:sulfotransferase family protein
MAKPTFLIIGGMKCGTTSLHHYLSEHPEIQRLPRMKETNFFSGPPEGIPYPPGSRRIEHLDEYERLFDDAYKMRGEASPCYTLYPRRKGVPERIKALLPDAKLIYLVRDPVARAVSQYHFSVSVENEKRSLREALSDVNDQYSLYTCPGFYAVQLERYLANFPQKNVLVIDQADLYSERQVTLREIFGFLEVDESFVSPLFNDEFNAGDERRTYSRFMILHRRTQAAAQRLPRGVRRFLRRSIERTVSRPLEPQALDDDLRTRLQEMYAPDVARLRELTGKSLSSWSL